MHYCEEYKTVTVNACSDLLNPSLVISNSRKNHKPEESKEPKEPEEPEDPRNQRTPRSPSSTTSLEFLLDFYLKATSLCDRVF